MSSLTLLTLSARSKVCRGCHVARLTSPTDWSTQEAEYNNAGRSSYGGRCRD